MKLIFDRITLEQVETEGNLSFSIYVPDDTKLTKTVTKTRMVPQEPLHIYETKDTIVKVAVQKSYEQKYITAMVDTEVWSEVNGEMVMSIEPRETLVAVEGVYLKPVFDTEGNIVSYEDSVAGTYEIMVDTVVTEVVKDEYESVPDLEEPYEETVQLTNAMDVAVAKFEYLTKLNGCTYAYADEFFNEDDLDLTVEGHSANTGMKIIEVLPGGFCQTKPIALDVPAKTFKLYHESDLEIQMYAVTRAVVAAEVVDDIVVKDEYEVVTLGDPQVFVDGQCSFHDVITEFALRFINGTDKVICGSAYAIMYNGGE